MAKITLAFRSVANRTQVFQLSDLPYRKAFVNQGVNWYSETWFVHVEGKDIIGLSSADRQPKEFFNYGQEDGYTIHFVYLSTIGGNMLANRYDSKIPAELNYKEYTLLKAAVEAYNSQHGVTRIATLPDWLQKISVP